MLTDGDVVPDLHEIIYLRTFANDRGSERAAIYRDVRADFDVVAKDHFADLRHFAVDARVEHITKTVRADN